MVQGASEAQPHEPVPPSRALQPSPSLTVKAADAALDSFLSVKSNLVSFWSEHEAIAPQWLCWAHPTDTLLMQSITPGGAFSTDMIYLQADKMYALGLNINVITLTVINQLLLRIAALPQLSMSLIFSPHILLSFLSTNSLMSSSLWCYCFVSGVILVFC